MSAARTINDGREREKKGGGGWTERVRTGADEISAYSITEIVEYSVTVVLKHLGMRVEAGVTEFGDLLGEELDTVCRVTEDDGLIDLKLVAKRKSKLPGDLRGTK